MSGARNWNDMSSQDQDSWFDDEEQQPQKAAQTTQTTQNSQPQENKPKPLEQKVESTSKPVQEKPSQSKKQEVKKQRKFLKDQQLLDEYINKTVDDTRVIKAARVTAQQHKKLLTSLSNARAKQIKDGLFIINFNQPEDLIAFIKDKIANRYRFFLQPYFKRKLEERQPRQQRKYNEERHNQREKGDRKPQDKPKEEQKKKQRRKPRYEDEQEEVQKKQKKQKTYVERKNQSKEKKEVKEKQTQKQIKKQTKNKEEDKSKKVYIAKETFEITKENNLLIKTQNFEWQKVIQQLESKKIFKNFKRVKITSPFAPTKLIKLLSQIGNKFKFFLDKPFPQGLKQQESFYFELLQNGPNQHLKAMHEKYAVRASRYQKQDSDEDKKPLKNNRDRQQKKAQQKTEQKPRLLGSNFNDYFNNIEKSNQNEIDKGFDQNEFVRRLKQNDRQIFQKNKCWRISAQQELIELLLKLTHRLTKSTVYDVNLKVAMKSQKSILTAELTPRPEQKRRPKVDVSGVNGYLS